jgi:hypothetical protein
MLRQWLVYACFYSDNLIIIVNIDNLIIIVNMIKEVEGLNEPLVVLTQRAWQAARSIWSRSTKALTLFSQEIKVVSW